MSYADDLYAVDQSRLVANLLKVLTVAITSSSALRPVTAGEDPDNPGRVRLTFKGPMAWAVWVDRLGGSTDAAIREVVDGEIQVRWMSPDAGIVCVHHERVVPVPSDYWSQS